MIESAIDLYAMAEMMLAAFGIGVLLGFVLRHLLVMAVVFVVGITFGIMAPEYIVGLVPSL